MCIGYNLRVNRIIGNVSRSDHSKLIFMGNIAEVLFPDWAPTPFASDVVNTFHGLERRELILWNEWLNFLPVIIQVSLIITWVIMKYLTVESSQAQSGVRAHSLCHM